VVQQLHDLAHLHVGLALPGVRLVITRTTLAIIIGVLTAKLRREKRQPRLHDDHLAAPLLLRQVTQQHRAAELRAVVVVLHQQDNLAVAAQVEPFGEKQNLKKPRKIRFYRFEGCNQAARLSAMGNIRNVTCAAAPPPWE
jgi:hypothetical protein